MVGAVVAMPGCVGRAKVRAADAPAPKPNIVYIMADDLGYADVGFNGCKEIKTPHLNTLAHAGVVLESFYVQPVCSPTRASLMIDYFTHKRDGEVDWHRDDKPCSDEGYSTHFIAKEACRLIRERNTAKPLFLYVPFNAVHGPFQVPENYTKPYAQLTGNRKTYAGMIAAMDEAVGQIVAVLEEKGMRDTTLIVFSSDNGGPSPGRITDNGPLRAGKGTIYEGGVRSCAFACWPGKIPGGKVVKEPVHGVDWYPTLVKLAGGSLEQKLPIDGKDIWPVVAQGARTPHDAVLLSSTVHGKAAVRMGDWKLIRGASDKDAAVNED